MLSIRSFAFKTLRAVYSLVLVTFAIIVLRIAMVTPNFFPKDWGTFDVNQTLPFLFLIFFSFTCFFIIPATASVFIFREPLRNLGLKLPQDKFKTVMLVIIALLLLIPSMYLLTKQPDFKNYYTLKHPTLLRLTMMVSLFPIYYFAEEFFFRGFLFLGLWNKIKWHSFWITEIIFTLSHIHKPLVEILLCIPASVIFNCLTLYTRSFYPAFIVHTIIGTFCVLFVNFNQISLF